MSDVVAGLIKNYISRRHVKLLRQKGSRSIRSDILLGGGTNIGLYWSPVWQMSPCQGPEQIEN